VLEVRVATPTEYDEAGELTARTYLDEGYADEHYAAVLRDVAGRAEDATVLVADLDGRLAGTVTFALGGTAYANVAGADEAEIRMLATTSAMRGHGVGTALVEECVRRAEQAGCSVVRLSTQPEMTTAQRIYQRLGFVRTPDRDWSPVPGVDLLTYELPLLFCGLCGERGRHEACDRLLALEPPRYCARCRRRMVVQVHPTGWTARCVEHGTTTSASPHPA
jgi:ribosomal protein S18 acetylase RimI-like enzyme